MIATAIPTPCADLGDLAEQLGHAWGVTSGASVTQYLAWSERAGIFALLARRDDATAIEVAAGTGLNERGADALLAVLASLRVVEVTDTGAYALSALAREYFVPDSPCYVGSVMYGDLVRELPSAYLRTPPLSSEPEVAPTRWPDDQRLLIQHRRNFPPSLVAARSGEFAGVRHLVDVAGGSGVLAIPLVLDDPRIKVTLIELPRIVGHIRRLLDEYGVNNRIYVVGADIFDDNAAFPACDGIFFGNVFHGYHDAACVRLARRAAAALTPGGRIWLHEVVFNPRKDGPLLAALWNANMVVRSEGRQRTVAELTALLQAAGFDNCYERPTSARFSLVAGVKLHGGH